MATGAGRDGRGRGRTGTGGARRLQWPRFGRRGVLAVSLSLLTLLSVLAVPTAGAAPAGSGTVASVDDGAGAPEPLAKGGPPAGTGGGNSSSNGGSSSGGGGTTPEAGSSSNSGAGSSGGGGSQDGKSNAKGNDQDGKSNAKGNDQDGKSNANGQAKGPNAGSQAVSKGGVEGAGVDVDVGSLPGVGPADRSNGGGNGGGPPDGAGPPENSNAGGDGNGDQGPPEAAPGGSRGDGPSVSVSTGPSDRPGGGPAGVASDGAAPTSVVGVEVRNARAGDRVELDVSPSSVEGDAVAFEDISVTVKRGGDFTMEVSNSRERLSGSPAFEPDQAADSLGRVRLEHSITNEEVEDVSYTFRVSKAHLRSTDTDPEDVALFRHADGGWSELPTDVVGETETHYLLTSDSPGMSEFAIGAKRPDFETFWADVEADSVDAGETVTVRGRVTNAGGADGVYGAELVVDGETVAERSITIAAGGTRQINFQAELDRSGTKRIAINGVAAGEVSVAESPEESATEGTEPTLAVLIDRILDVGHTLGITSPSSGADR